jgi:hypothetical protein
MPHLNVFIPAEYSVDGKVVEGPPLPVTWDEYPGLLTSLALWNGLEWTQTSGPGGATGLFTKDGERAGDWSVM